MPENEDTLKQVLAHYPAGEAAPEIIPYGEGLINRTWKIVFDHGVFILQKINNNIFKQPADIEFNIRELGHYLENKHPGYLFIRPLYNLDGDQMTHTKDGYFRLFPFLKGSHTINVVHTTDQAYEASRQFGLFTRNCSDFPIDTLRIILPGFHDLSLRYNQFETSLENGNKERISQCRPLIKYIRANENILRTYELIVRNGLIRKRVTHHDTKISNVLFDKNQRGICVIDLDTVMPGYFISDVGDMIRTYLCPVNEEEKDVTKIRIREDYFIAVFNGYMNAMGQILSTAEKDYFIYAGKFMIYMQALRFFTDYLGNDIYYKIDYPDQNLIRTKNQLKLLDCLVEKEDKLQKMISQLR